VKKSVSKIREAYKLLAIASGLAAEDFNYRCSTILMETADEREVPRTPELWLDAAKEVTWVALCEKHGKKEGEKLFRLIEKTPGVA
jgi:hypothetical protein